MFFDRDIARKIKYFPLKYFMLALIAHLWVVNITHKAQLITKMLTKMCASFAQY